MEMSLVDSLWFTRHTCQYCPTPLCLRANPLPHGSSITIISNISSSIDTPQQIIPQVHPTIFTPRSSIRIEPDSTPSRCSLSAIRQGHEGGGGPAVHRRIAVMMMTTRRYPEARRNV
eukprot:scaffold10382_cov47-Cyclotella_meneghiniana.AAC.6